MLLFITTVFIVDKPKLYILEKGNTDNFCFFFIFGEKILRLWKSEYKQNLHILITQGYGSGYY